MPEAGVGTFVLSFDVELAWGEFYRGPVGHERLLAARRCFPDLLRLLERHAIPATFAVLGHLLLEGCDGHPAMPRPRLGFGPEDWYGSDPATDEARDPSWYAPSLVRMLRAAHPGHDVGSHGFCHVPLDAPGAGREVAEAEIRAAASALRGIGLEPGSFVFPRNGIKYTELLEEQGFTCYRAVEDRWYRGRGRFVRKVGHLLDQALAVTPPVGDPVRSAPPGTVSSLAPIPSASLVEVPSSMLFLSREGVRRRLPMRARVLRARRGLDRAAATGRVFHLWLHAEDLVPGLGQMLAGLDAVLAGVRRRVDRGELRIRTMAALAAECCS